MVRELSAVVTLGGRERVITFVYYEDDWEQYRPTWEQAGVGLVWYEKLGFHARAFSWGTKIHLWKCTPSLVGHEILHQFDTHHPDTFFAAIKHAILSGFSWASFTGLLRWRSNNPELDAQARRISNLLRGSTP